MAGWLAVRKETRSHPTAIGGSTREKIKAGESGRGAAVTQSRDYKVEAEQLRASQPGSDEELAGARVPRPASPKSFAALRGEQSRVE